jgi:hypothetical protein
MRGESIKCNLCKREKEQTNHWFVVIERPGMEGLLILPIESAGEPIKGYTYKDLCGEACAHKYLSAWLEELKNVNYPTKGDAA